MPMPCVQFASSALALHRASAAHRTDRAFCMQVARCAVRSLYAELCLYPKPGLVSLVDNGSHDDMTAHTFMRSMFSLRGYFVGITLAGMAGKPFASLKRLGVAAERRMLMATGGVNTHRGAIFCLGLLCAAIGYCHRLGVVPNDVAIRSALLDRYGVDLITHMQTVSATSNGSSVALLHAASGAREEAARGLPSVFDVALPALRQAIASGRDVECASIDALFALMAHISDTNVYHRGGANGADMVKACAVEFLQSGATANPHWRAHALACHRAFVSRRLSPGGAADLLAASLLVHQVTQRYAA